MDLFSLGFVLLILVASGGIAYAADILGKKLGKKRLSIKIGKRSLRPKHVAALGTVLMGVAVSLLTILFVAAVSRDAREWLIEGRGLLVEQGKLKKEVQGLKAERLAEEEAKREITTNLELVRKQLEAERGEVKTQRVAVADLDRKRKGLAADVGRLNGEVARLGGELSRSQGALTRSHNDLIAAAARLTGANVRLSGVKNSLQVAQNKLRGSLAELKTSRLNLEAINKQKNKAQMQSLVAGFEIKKLEAKIEDTKKEVAAREGVVASLQKQTIELDDQRKEAEGKLGDVKAQYEIAGTQLDEATARLAELRSVAESQQSFLSGPTFASRTQDLTFRKGEELARVVVPARADAAVAANALATLLRAARAEAAERGAKGHKANGQTFEVADVFDRQDPKTKKVVSADALKRAVVAQAAARPGDQVLVATSSLNAFGGEAVSLDVAVMPNPVVYRRNEMVAEARIDGSLTDDRILEQLSEFVRSRVRERASQDKMIPRTGTPEPFGEVPAADVWKALGDVKKAGRSVRVQALAETETRAADPLKLEFRVR